jgi:predicted transcriptional regulator
MPNNSSMTLTLPPEVDAALDALARDSKRSKAALVKEVISDFVERNAWQVARIRQGVAEAQSGTPGVPHVEVEKWVRSWGTDAESPRPKPES